MQRFEHHFTAMGGPCRIHVDCPSERAALDALAAAEEEVHRLEHKYSRYLSDSLTSQINRGAGTGKATPIDTETSRLLDYANTLWEQSEGLFDLTSGVLRRAWDFKSGQLPSQSQLDPLLLQVDWSRVQRDNDSILLPQAGMELDFGGCVKEYGADSAAAVLQALGVEHLLVDLAGDMAARGGQGDGSPWRIGIRSPVDAGRAVAGVDLASGGLASSGNYERCIEIEGRRYGHILNPGSGWPVEGLVAVSVTAPQCLVAGSSATIALLQPEAEALLWLEALGLPWLAVDQQGVLHGTLNK